MSTDLVSCTDVSHAFGSLQVLSSVSLSIARGEIVAIMGPSGCGKSTLLRVIAGLERPNRGHVALDGREVRQPHPEVRYSFQDFDALPWLTVGRSVDLSARDAEPGTAAKALSEVGLSEFTRAYPRQLSGGMKKRLALARAIAAKPRLILLDEPFSSLDVAARESLYEMLQAVCSHRGCSIILVTHDVEEAVFLADRVVVGSPRPFSVRAEIRCQGLDRPRTGKTRLSASFELLASDVRNALLGPSGRV